MDYPTPRLLEDLRFIYDNPEPSWLDGAVGTEKALRELHRDYPAEFLERLDRLEREHARAVAAIEKRLAIDRARELREPKEEPREEVDEGAERSLALCEEFILRAKLKAEGTDVQDKL